MGAKMSRCHTVLSQQLSFVQDCWQMCHGILYGVLGVREDWVFISWFCTDHGGLCGDWVC